jgi:hypothetical protein
MPPSRHRIPPQTSRQVRKAYVKANKHFEFTPTQARASERRLELGKRAQALQAKEQRKRDNKRKREEKEAAEREAKRKRIESGKAPIEDLWGKVRASQPRLSAFFAQTEATDKEEDCQSGSGDRESLAYDHDLEQEGTDTLAEHAAQDSGADTKGLEAFFSSPAFGNTPDMVQTPDSQEGDVPTQSAVGELVADVQNNKTTTATSGSEDSDQALLEAQLALSQGISDFDIAEDDDAEWMPIETENINASNVLEVQSMQNRPLTTLSKRKAEQAGFEFTSPAKSARSALSEMSPSKVNIRTQEKPDILSVASSAAQLPTPSPIKPASMQSPADILAMIATQDLEDDEFATDKENEDPWQVESRKRLQKDGNSKENNLVEGGVKRDASNDRKAAKHTQGPSSPYDEDIFDDDDFANLSSDLDDDYDDYDNDLDDEALAALAAKSPSAHKLALLSTKSTVTRAAGSPKTAKPLVNTTPIPGNASSPHSMHPPSPKSAAVVLFQPQQPAVPATQGNSFAFDDVQDDDLTAFAEKLDAGDLSAAARIGTKTKLSRTIPWQHPSPLSTTPGSDEPLSQDDDPPYD